MQKVLYAFIIAFFSIVAFSCQRELSGSIDTPGPGPSTNPDPVTATVQGKIMDENGQPATGVLIKAGTKSATTDAKGYFRITNASLDKGASLVTAEKSGYFKSYRSFRATNGANHVEIKLIKKVSAGTISSSTGGSVTFTNGAKVALPVNGVVKAAGGAYTGDIKVFAAYIDPTATDISGTVPGSFMADDKDNNRVLLQSYGMMAVELESTSGEKLQIASGQVATLTTPIPAAAQATAPATISLWYVDEQTGIWKEEGTATRNGSHYIGNVKHFSFWNCDVNVPTIALSTSLKNSHGNPLIHVMVRIKRPGATYLAESYGWTDSLGQVSGLVPKNEALVLEVLDNCHNVVVTQNIGPFTTNTTLPTITVNIPTTLQLAIKGKLLNCSGQPVTNGSAIITYGGNTWYISTNSTGDFQVDLINCTPSATVTIIGEDKATQQQGSPVTVPVVAPLTNAGSLAACGTSTSQFINYTVDGTSYSINSITPNDSLVSYTTNAQVGPYPLNTYFNGASIGGTKNFTLMFGHNPATGTYAALGNEFRVNGFTNIQVVQPFLVILTSYPAVPGEFFEGSFSGQFQETASGTMHTTSGTFRVRK